MKFDTKPIWDDIRAAFGLDATGAAIAVALYEAHPTGVAVSYSRSSDFYASDKMRHPLLTLSRVKRAADTLAELGLIRHFKQVPGYRNWQSAMSATDEFAGIIADIVEARPRMKLILPRENIIVRDADGLPTAFRKTRELDRQSRKVSAFSEAIASSEITADGFANLAAPLVRIYNQDTSRGGRFYGMGTSHQNIRAAVRKSIKIDGEDAVELDFATLHPAMLYAEAGAPLPADCYDLGPEWPRPLVKVAMLTLINARTIQAARMSIAHNPQMAAVATPGEQEALRKASALISAIKRKHKPIEASFHSDAGARLMRRDADIAEAVMAEMIIKRGIVTLPVHDSFMVPASKAAELEAAMLAAAHQHGLTSLEVRPAK